MQRAVRNLGREGLAACAISAVDVAFWDLKARLLGIASVACSGDVERRYRSTAAVALPLSDEQLGTIVRLGRAGRLPLGQDEDRQ